MMHHNHQRFYQYAGPPSIVMGTWGDRTRSTFAPPPPPFAIPPAGVPGGRLGPAPVQVNRISAGYHSLQYTPPPQEYHHAKKKHSNELHKLPQVKLGHNQAVFLSAFTALLFAKILWNSG